MNGSSTPLLRYDAVAIALHWLLGAAIVALIAMGWYMSGLAFSPQRLKLYNWHKWAGVAVLALSLLRLAWRLAHRAPALPQQLLGAMPRWQKWLHHGVHGLIYALCLVVPLVGWAYSSAAGLPVVFLGVLALPDWVPVSAQLADAIKPWHALAAYTLAVLVLLHVAAALKHQFVDRVALMARMWPGSSSF